MLKFFGPKCIIVQSGAYSNIIYGCQQKIFSKNFWKYNFCLRDTFKWGDIFSAEPFLRFSRTSFSQRWMNRFVKFEKVDKVTVLNSSLPKNLAKSGIVGYSVNEYDTVWLWIISYYLITKTVPLKKIRQWNVLHELRRFFH